MTIQPWRRSHRLRSNTARGNNRLTVLDNTVTGRAPRHRTPRLLVILNHSLGQRRDRQFRHVLAGLRDVGCAVDVRSAHVPGDAGRLARAADRSAFDAIAVAGGDGTLNDALNGLTATSPALGLIPIGTANVLAREIGLDSRPEAVVGCLARGRVVAIRPGLANGRRFFMMASAGFDAQVVDGLDLGLKQRIGKAAYAVEAMRRIVHYPCPPLDLRIDGRAISAATLVACRGRHYGGRFVLAPRANLTEPRFQVALFRRPGRLAMAGYSLALPLGLLTRLNLIDHVIADRIEIAGPAGAPVQGDGDVIARLPVAITIAPDPVRLIVPGT